MSNPVPQPAPYTYQPPQIQQPPPQPAPYMYPPPQQPPPQQPQPPPPPPPQQQQQQQTQVQTQPQAPQLQQQQPQTQVQPLPQPQTQVQPPPPQPQQQQQQTQQVQTQPQAPQLQQPQTQVQPQPAPYTYQPPQIQQPPPQPAPYMYPPPQQPPPQQPQPPPPPPPPQQQQQTQVQTQPQAPQLQQQQPQTQVQPLPQPQTQVQPPPPQPQQQQQQTQQVQTQPQAPQLQQPQTQVQPQPQTQPQPQAPQLQPQVFFPDTSLLQGSRQDYVNICVPLYEAAMKGDWETARPILVNYPVSLRAAISENYDTVLHIAASAERTKAVEDFVWNLLARMNPVDRELQNTGHNTALCLAAAAGNLETAKMLVTLSPNLMYIPDSNNMVPLYIAAVYGRHEMVEYMYYLSSPVLPGPYWNDVYRGWFLQRCVEAEIFDVALHIVGTWPDILTNQNRIAHDILVALAQMTHVFCVKEPNIIIRTFKSSKEEYKALILLRTIWKSIATMPKTDIDNILQGPPGTTMVNNRIRYPSRILFLATKKGNTRFIIELIRLYPDLIWARDDKGKTIFHLAIKRREAEIYNLLHEIGSKKDAISPMQDMGNNTMLHMVATSAKFKNFQNVSGVALQMQQDLLWFKEVEKMVPPALRQLKNKDGDTAKALLEKKHAHIVTKGVDWMENYMLVATLIATIVFAAAFTLPGGYDQETGIPFFHKEPSLIIFVISDAVSLISSSTSVLIFLSIITSSYEELDFFETLPERLLLGLTTLFLSIVSMMVAFSASFFILYKDKVEWLPILVTWLAGIPVILVAVLHIHRFLKVCYMAYRSKYLFNRKKRKLYF